MRLSSSKFGAAKIWVAGVERQRTPRKSASWGFDARCLVKPRISSLKPPLPCFVAAKYACFQKGFDRRRSRGEGTHKVVG